jgi:hypothetical protein
MKPMKRPQFSLRTLFVVVTILALPLGWLAWQANIVHHRQAMRAMLEAHGGRVFLLDIEYRIPPLVETLRPADIYYNISAVRELFGDLHVSLIAFDRRLTSAEHDATEAFPESEVMAVP